jgi:hypothetical protein
MDSPTSAFEAIGESHKGIHFCLESSMPGGGSQSLIPSPRFTGLFALQNAAPTVVYND